MSFEHDELVYVLLIKKLLSTAGNAFVPGMPADKDNKICGIWTPTVVNCLAEVVC